MTYITGFERLLNIEEDGGKGHHLKQLTAFGFNVPEGVVVGASFYRENYPAPPAFTYEDEAKLGEQCEEMAEKVSSMPLPEAFASELREHLHRFPAETRYAVRSSSTYEDLAGAAFAGQHETFLNVTADEVAEKVRECFASLWQKHAVLYRRYQGFSQEGASMAVVIQRMIAAETAGVAFSVDPVSGNLDYVLVEGNYGVGESVVGGEAVTDSWVVDTSQGRIVERRVSEKEYYVVPAERGVKTRLLPPEYRETPCLSDEQILEIAGVAKKIEREFQTPQDIEWAYADGRLYILQARPQTTIPPRFTRDESAERFPEPLTPLTWSYVEDAFNASLEHSLRLMNVHLPTRPWFALRNCYVYGNQNAVRLLALNKPIELRTVDTLVDELTFIEEKFRWVMELPNAWMRDLDTYLIRVGKLGAVSFDGFSAPDFQRYFKELFSTAKEYFLPNIAISMTQGFLTRTLFEYIAAVKGDLYEAQTMLKQIITASGTKTGQINRELYELAKEAKRTPELMSLLAEGGKRALAGLDRFPDFAASFRSFIDNYGHREISFDYYKPTWAEAPEVVLDLIHLAATSGKQEKAGKKEKLGKMVSLKATQELLELSPKSLRYFVNELVRLTLTYTYIDDLEHFQTTRVNLLARRAVGALGTKLVNAGQLTDPYDLFFLVKEELESIDSFELSAEMREKIALRKEAYLRAYEQEPTWDLTKEGEGMPTGENDGEESEGLLRGIPGSPGECEGVIYVVRGPEDFANMPDQAILVARTTNPAWTPLFYKAKGLITESGGPLSHGAVTAREVGIPAVMCVRGALKRFKTGERVRLDGRRGHVHRTSVQTRTPAP
ncbi:PEP/pyruvate-binding domain-containing protein [Aneurinibacillus sp. UBA3580]|jgi:pyruvate,water dikinase|uniref:PEP/pyruvate-binding domain-containing protein n=1 Tax=Aneurinibacillus sp. UBA3580 TaxID=1946041 RepID=UPI00257AE081|nr:PEP/pyruvate-binding domain-containing protein [Aneurinibacillus sp. UBA3580]